jgi:LDH2 family malate/lactate/ureidoglycolate dehydrogenase
VDELIAFIKSRKTAPGFKEILLPGEQGRKNDERQMRDGVEIDEETWTEVLQLANELGIRDLPDPI